VVLWAVAGYDTVNDLLQSVHSTKLLGLLRVTPTMMCGAMKEIVAWPTADGVLSGSRSRPCCESMWQIGLKLKVLWLE